MKAHRFKTVIVAASSEENPTGQRAAIQSVSIEKEENGTVFCSVHHDGGELNLNLDNLLRLRMLITETVDQFAVMQK